MSFHTLAPRLQPVAHASLKYFTYRFGKNGLKINTEISPGISWRPTFHLKATSSLIVAAEVSDGLYPEILKIAAHDLLKFDFPVAVFLVCPLDTYLSDKKQTSIRSLKADGFGLITVDDHTVATIQHNCVPLAQHLSEDSLDTELGDLSPTLKVTFRAAHDTYAGNVGQGLQAGGQIVEALVMNIAKGAVKANLVNASVLKQSAADAIDELYSLQPFKNHRAALGGARDFAKEYRNIASHPAKSAKEAIDKIRKCKTGFINAIRIAKNLCAVLKAKGYKIVIHTT